MTTTTMTTTKPPAEGTASVESRGLAPPIRAPDRGLPVDGSSRSIRIPPVIVRVRAPARGRPPRTEPSRADTIVAGSREYLAAHYMAVCNWHEATVEQFAEAGPVYRPPEAVTAVVLHESRGRRDRWSPEVFENLLNRPGNLGMHGYLDRDGTLIQHNDLVEDLNHSRIFSRSSVGFEIINPMIDAHVSPRSRSSYERIPVVWDRDNAPHYLVPPIEQLEAVTILVGWLTSPSCPLAIPREWPRIREVEGRRVMVVLPLGESRSEESQGVVAHGQIQLDKSDGLFPLLYSWLRLEAERSPQEALEEARVLLSQTIILRTRGVDLSGYATTPSGRTFDFPVQAEAEVPR